MLLKFCLIWQQEFDKLFPNYFCIVFAQENAKKKKEYWTMVTKSKDEKENFINSLKKVYEKIFHVPLMTIRTENVSYR